MTNMFVMVKEEGSEMVMEDWQGAAGSEVVEKKGMERLCNTLQQQLVLANEQKKRSKGGHIPSDIAHSTYTYIIIYNVYMHILLLLPPYITSSRSKMV